MYEGLSALWVKVHTVTLAGLGLGLGGGGGGGRAGTVMVFVEQLSVLLDTVAVVEDSK